MRREREQSPAWAAEQWRVLEDDLTQQVRHEAEEAAMLLGLSRQAVDTRRRAGRLLALTLAEPAFGVVAVFVVF